jgi:competence protein ComEA
MKNVFFFLMSLVFVAICAFLVISARNSEPAYVEVTVINEQVIIEVAEPVIQIVNINTACLEELTTLHGIGPAIGQRIIDHRENNSLFMTVEELMLVRGIGEATFERIKDNITIH